MVNKAIAIIPARGGSKRIPQKNIIDFFGKPLIAWTIEAAVGAGIFEKIIVSTDNPAIAEIAVRFGAEVPFFRDQCNDDHSPVGDATLYCLSQAEQEFNQSFHHVIQLMPNCPLRNAEDILDAYQHFVTQESESQISCFKYGWMNPWWAVKINSQFQPEYLFPETFHGRSQDLPELYCPSGAIWIARREVLVRHRDFFSEHVTFFPMRFQAMVDIDTFEDLAFAKAIYQMNHLKTDQGIVETSSIG